MTNSTKDFNIKMSVRNGRLLQAIRGKYESAAEFSRAIGVAESRVSALVSMRAKPVNKNGTWRDIAETISAALGVYPSDLWPEHLQEVRLKRSTSELNLDAEEAQQVIAGDPMKAIEHTDLANKLLVHCSDRQRVALDAMMNGATLEEMGKELGVTRERARQIYMKACRKMREKAVQTMGRAEVDRMRF